MLKVLLVDDDSTKIKNIMSLINDYPSVEVKVCLDLKEARSALHTVRYDLMLLDIQLPLKIGGEINTNGGITLLEELIESDKIIKPLEIIGITSSPDSLKQHSNLFMQYMYFVLEVNSVTTEWIDKLKNKLEYMIDCRADMLQDRRYDFDLAIITAIKQEFESVRELSSKWEDVRIKGDPTEYSITQFQNADRKVRVVLAMQHQMGMTAAAVLSSKLIYNFTPKYLIMVGIAAGNKHQGVNLGDILIASESWDYGSGKVRENGDKGRLFQAAPHQLPLDVKLKEKLNKNFNDILYKIRENWKFKKPTDMLQMHVGPIATGSSVIQDSSVVKELIDTQHRKLLGLEMETYGVFFAAYNGIGPTPKVLSIKSVCDFADIEKGDNYHEYASYTSAAFMQHLAINELSYDD
ncbi:phosphorylase family protein [Cohnella endophytica]|uniref:phosphorylase family protein n=1 Tax=Cohnella endophytica TaxID=2419778 RepID=UPI0013142E43|nr:response regulator [Cohnella endophytica]